MLLNITNNRSSFVEGSGAVATPANHSPMAEAHGLGMGVDMARAPTEEIFSAIAYRADASLQYDGLTAPFLQSCQPA